MADFVQVRPLYWTEVSVGWPERARNLGIWLQTNTHRNLEGLYRLPYGYVTADLGWLPRQVDEHMTTLIGEGFAEYDAAAQVVLVRECLRVTQPKSPKQLIGALRALRRLPRTPLMRSLFELALEVDDRGKLLADRFAVVLAEEFGFTFPDPFPDSLAMALAEASEWVCDRVWRCHPEGTPHASSRARSRAPEPEPEPEPEPDPLTPAAFPSPPTAGGARRLERFAAQVAEWRRSSRPSSEDEERWSNARAALDERMPSAMGQTMLDALHVHGSPNGRLVLGVHAPHQSDWLRNRLGSALTDVVGSWELVDCGCEVRS